MKELISESKSHKAQDVIEHLSQIIDSYIAESPKVRSINALSKQCLMSEATLRRIYKKQIKLAPNVSVILDILFVISKESSILEISKKYLGPVADYLKESLPDSNFIEINYDTHLNNEFENSTKYLLYKLSSNNSGVSEDKIKELFGSTGLYLLRELIESGYIVKEDEVFKSTQKNFQSNQSSFNKNFKAVSNFIKPFKLNVNHGLNSVRVNYSESVSEQAYKQMIRIQRKAIEKIRDLMADEKNAGKIPAFMLVGIDTLDSQSFDELNQNN